ncbi:Tn3 family transposase [Rhizobium binxianense]
MQDDTNFPSIFCHKHCCQATRKQCGARFWRVDAKADYGILDDIASNRINMKLIADHWDDLLRLAGSLKLDVVQAAGLTRTRPNRLARALQELGRLVTTLYLLRFMDGESYRRRILIQLNRGEGRHQLAGVIFHGKPANCASAIVMVRRPAGALGLVVNLVLHCNTIYTDAALNQLVTEDYDVRPEDVARLCRSASSMSTCWVDMPSRSPNPGCIRLPRRRHPSDGGFSVALRNMRTSVRRSF